MAGIYVHIPFCKQKCSYCNFHFSTQLGKKEQMVEAIIKEINLRKEELSKETIKTIYFGGGTPSLLHQNELESLFIAIENNFSISNKAEITIESNPDDIDSKSLKHWKSLEINRLSIGVQSFYDEDLQFMNRAHNSSQATDSIKRAQDMGFENITIDLIYGSPTTTKKIWKDNLQKVKELQVPHLSSYALTVEPKTQLAHDIQNKKTHEIDEEKQFEHFQILQEFAKENHLIQYEISNFGKEGFFSEHNQSYWNASKYLGIGPSAHSFNGENIRRYNIANNSQYIQKLNQNQVPYQEEILNESQRYNELIMTGLRSIEGIDNAYMNKNFSQELLMYFNTNLQKYLDEEIIIFKNQKILLNPKNYFQADGIASDLFKV